MKKLTAGILTVMLGIVSANSADAAVASKGYVDAKVKTNADAIDGLTTTVNQHTNDIAGKVSQSAYDTKIGQLEDADADISDLVGTLPEGTTATTIVGYIDKKTEGIASQGAMTELSNQVSTLSGKVGTNTDAIATLNGDASTTGSVAKQIADSITALDLANTYASKTTVETAYQNAINTAEQNAKDYADGLGSNYATAAQGALAASALQQADITAGATNGTISVDGSDVAVTGLGSAAFTESTAYDAAGAASTAEAAAKKYTDDEIQALDSSIAAEANKVVTGVTVEDGKITATQKMALSAIATINPACSNPANYCVLTSNGTDFVWEVIERATDGSETLTTGGDSGRTAATTVAQ